MCDATFLADDFEVQDILKIIWAIDINKAHGHDNRTGIIKICDSGILKPLSITLCNALNSGIFPDN